jgi:dienelactone hydrolase
VASIQYRLAPIGRCVRFINGDTEVFTEAELNNETRTETVNGPGCENRLRMAADDLQMALRYLQDHADDYGIDATRIAAFGWSAGGGTVQYAGFSVTEEPDTGLDAVISLASSAQTARDDGLMDPDDAPLLHFVGDADNMAYDPADGTPFDHMRRSHLLTVAAGTPVVFVTMPGEGHIPSTANWALIDDLMRRFLWRQLDLEDADT